MFICHYTFHNSCCFQNEIQFQDFSIIILFKKNVNWQISGKFSHVIIFYLNRMSHLNDHRLKVSK